jgi:acyl carrier protein
MEKEQFISDLAEILDEEVVNESDVLADFEAWDSLTILSIISYAQQHFKKVLKNDDIRSLETVGDLFAFIENK